MSSNSAVDWSNDQSIEGKANKTMPLGGTGGSHFIKCLSGTWIAGYRCCHRSSHIAHYFPGDFERKPPLEGVDSTGKLTGTLATIVNLVPLFYYLGVAVLAVADVYVNLR